ncbi:diacylglycerol/lipid kinase family protein [Marisediminicola sp. LYQ85]|uniref:diacylglycerol/lipid kinase family protein n=1 Tax=Marisediminicola sp. LYQ85 TaxID=3391062 RepID=UPI003983B3D7
MSRHENDSSHPAEPARTAAAEATRASDSRSTRIAAEKAAKKTEAHADAPASVDKRAAVVYNPIKVNIAKLRASVAAAEKTAGWQSTVWFETSVEDPGERVTREALEHDVDVVMAAGGDGTVRSVAEALRGTRIPLGLLPSGTGNLLARNLHLTLDDLDKSVSTAFTGRDRPIDLGVVEVQRPDESRERFIFLVMAGLGLDAQMIANTDPELKKRVGWIAYVDAIRKSLKGNNRLNIRYNLDGQGNRTVRVHTVLIGNCGSLPGNILLLPDAAVDDGEFDIVALRPEGFFGWVQIWVKIVWENGVLRRSQVGRKIMSLTKEVRTLRYLKGKDLVVRLGRAEEFELDGDAFGELVALKASVDPLALLVKVPADS